MKTSSFISPHHHSPFIHQLMHSVSRGTMGIQDTFIELIQMTVRVAVWGIQSRKVLTSFSRNSQSCRILGRNKYLYSSRLDATVQFSSVQSLSRVWFCDPHGLLHARLPGPSPTPRACSSSYPSSQWCHPTISSSIISYSSCLQSCPASESFPMTQFFASGGQSIRASVSVLPMNIEGWFPVGLMDLICLQSKGLSRGFSNTTVQKHQFFGAQLSLWYSSHIHIWLLEKPWFWLYRPLLAK